VLLTVLGEFVLPRRGEAFGQETLINALETIDYKTHAARQALARSISQGWLLTERHGRRAPVVQ
jgi:phenylacetic acid degradation operon negative regulatory protein